MYEPPGIKNFGFQGAKGIRFSRTGLLLLCTYDSIHFQNTDFFELRLLEYINRHGEKNSVHMKN